MKTLVKTTTATTSAPATTSASATVSTTLINGRAYVVDDSKSFHIFTNAEDANSETFYFSNIGNGVWWNEKMNKKLVGFCLTTCDISEYVVITDEFDWVQFFSLPFKASGSFDGTTWEGYMKNRVSEQIYFRSKFIYKEDESFANMKKEFTTNKGIIKIVDSVESLFNLFYGFEEFIYNKGVRAINPFI